MKKANCLKNGHIGCFYYSHSLQGNQYINKDVRSIALLFVLGFSQILHHPEILKALNPVYAYELLVEYPKGFWLLGGGYNRTL